MRSHGTIVWVYADVSLASGSDFARFESLIRQIPEVYECSAVGEGTDYIVKFAVPDLAHYQRVMDGLVSCHVGVVAYATHVITRCVKKMEPAVRADTRRSIPIRRGLQ